MPTFNVSLKDGAPAEELQKAKQSVIDKGGKIVREFTLVKGFTAQLPDDQVGVLESNQHCLVEPDSEVRTQ